MNKLSEFNPYGLKWSPSYSVMLDGDSKLERCEI